MKTKKILIALIAILIAVSALAFAACELEDADKSLDNALALASKCYTTCVRLTKGDVLYYSFEKSGESDAVISDPYDTGVTEEGIVDFTKNIKSSITAADITVTDKNYSEDSGAIKLTATFKDASKVLGVEANDAKLEVDGNIVSGKVNSYRITYVDSHGYTVEIALS